MLWELCRKLYGEEGKGREKDLRALAKAVEAGDRACFAAFFTRYRFFPVLPPGARVEFVDSSTLIISAKNAEIVINATEEEVDEERKKMAVLYIVPS
ncbi:MAG: hypothetical protein QXI07_09595 [Pyrobaculum sp.]